MALNDTYSATLASSLAGESMLNTFYFQITAESGNDDDMESLAQLVQDEIVPEVQKWCSDQWQADNAIVRRLKPAITDSLVLPLSGNGDLPQLPLPTTCYMLIGYYSSPYVKGSSYHWKFSGLPHDANNQGKLTDAAIVRATDFINKITGGNIIVNGNAFNPINSKDAGLGGGAVLPQIDKARVNPLIRNVISRQPRPLG